MTSKQGPAKKSTKGKRKIQLHVPSGIAHVKATFNNTIVTITDMSGHVIAWSSAGKSGFNHSKKSSAYAGMVTGQSVGKDAVSFGMKEAEVRISGPGAGRESAVRGLQSSGLNITAIKDVTPIQHNGCRPRKRRRA